MGSLPIEALELEDGAFRPRADSNRSLDRVRKLTPMSMVQIPEGVAVVNLPHERTRRVSSHSMGMPVILESVPVSKSWAESKDVIPSTIGKSNGLRLTTFESLRVSLRHSLRNGKDSLRSIREHVPSIDNYRNFNKHARPTLDALHESSEDTNTKPVEDGASKPVDEGVKFGWIEGVLVRNMLSIWGTMLFLRISWVVAQAGIWQTLIIIAFSTFITMVTALSMSAIMTNGEVGGGGTYYVMSRSLGPGFCGSIGILFAIANAINASLNVVGFAQTLQDLLKQYFNGLIIVDGGDHDTRIIGTITMIFIVSICGLGMKYEAKTQVFLLLILLIALANFLAGSIMGYKSESELSKGFLGYSDTLFATNWEPDFRLSDGIYYDFFSVFSVYFPAAIGILAGANISGDLKNPSSAIPKGTILAIIITSLTYAAIAIICAGTTFRLASGNVTEVNVTDPFLSLAFNCTSDPTRCLYGLHMDFQVMNLISAFGPLNYAGCFAASLSSALASYVSAPKLLQVIGDDNIYPYLQWFSKGYGKTEEPIRAYILFFIIAIIFIEIAQLNTIALLISAFFLATFALMNFCTFHQSLIKPIGWRPTFKYYNMWLSLLNAIVCVVVMFLLSWVIALITFGIIIILYLIVLYKKPDVNWGSSSQAQVYKSALTSMHQLNHTEEHVKNFIPQILLLTGPPQHRPALIDFAHEITKRQAMLICGHIVQPLQTRKERCKIVQNTLTWINQRKLRAFYSCLDNSTLEKGTRAMLQGCGVGKMRPNILMMGYKNNWRSSGQPDLDGYFSVIHTGLDLHMGVTILRVEGGFDLSDQLELNKFPLERSSSEESSCSQEDPNQLTVTSMRSMEDFEVGCDRALMFKRKQKKSTIDVWWLYDDGGLTLLLPYILTLRSCWSKSKLRFFCIASGPEELTKEHENMEALLDKFRIDYSDVIIVPNADQLPKASTVAWFDGITRDLVHKEDAENKPQGVCISDKELRVLREKTNRQLRLRELLQEHSKDASLVAMTLPMPRKGAVSGAMYMAWLESLSNGMPPFLLIRGNQTSVLTFYS